MAIDDNIELKGIITKVERGGRYKVSLFDDDKEILVSLSGKMRKNKIKVVLGDRVTVRVSPYDLSKGTIRHRDK